MKIFSPRSYQAPLRRSVGALALCAALPLLMGALACGGGGGGGGSGGGGSTGGTGVRVLPAAIDSVPVDVISSAESAVVVSQARFTSVSAYRSLRSGPQILSLTKAFNAAQVIDSFKVDYESGVRYSILLFGDHGPYGIHAALIKDEVPATIEGAVVRVVNGVMGSSTVSATIGSAGASTVKFGEAGEYVVVPAGSLTVSTSRTADGQPASSNVLVAEQGKAYTVLVAGEIGYYSKGVIYTDN